MRYFWKLTVFVATQTSCLKDSHTNLEKYVGIGTKILWRLLEFVCQKRMLPATSNSCLKYVHTNFSINVGTGT
jgi:hypothetical protein